MSATLDCFLLFGTSFVLYDQNGEEKYRTERLGGPLAPIWDVSFSPIKIEDSDVVVAVDWTQSLSFYDLNGKTVCY